MVAQKKPKPEEDPLSAHLYVRTLCANCGKKISKKRLKRAKEEGWLPLCKDCDKFLKEQLEKCRPLMKALTGGK